MVEGVKFSGVLLYQFYEEGQCRCCFTSSRGGVVLRGGPVVVGCCSTGVWGPM